MDITPRTLSSQWSTPYFIEQAKQIAKAVRGVKDIRRAMNISAALADTVTVMYRDWGDATKPSIYMYRGDVYKGFYADTLSRDDIQWAQEHIWIASGLYGLLRPQDGISQYRLEMKTKLPVGKSKNLYEFWGDCLARYADEHAHGIICMLASEEYGKPIRKFSMSRIITPVFMDHKPNGSVGAVPIYSKMMRGVMARWIIDHRVDTPEKLKEFTGFDYYFDGARSTTDAPVFVREKMTPLVF